MYACGLLPLYSMQESGLSQWIGEKLEVFKEVNHWGMLFIICYIAAATTEVTSNSAISTLLMPILSRLVSLAVTVSVCTFACQSAHMPIRRSFSLCLVWHVVVVLPSYAFSRISTIPVV